jgi:putative nucleotidyltransferase with HDIG domain
VPQALEILDRRKTDVVITDVVMPGESGISLLEKVKKKYGYETDVMVITGFADDLEYEEIIRKGACDFIKKPLSPRELLIRLKRVLRERSTLMERNQATEKLNESIGKLKRILDETVNTLGSALEKRDPYTAGHQHRVARLSCAIAEEIGLSKDCIEGIRIAGLLHDIGKISTPTDILNKPSKLSVNEFNLIKEHSRTGYEILKNIESNSSIADLVLQHHERMNGTGYPLGIAGKDILLEARILAVADCVEAIDSHRPYRPALGMSAALEEISMNRGTLYDAQVVDTCLRLINERGFTW